MTKNMTNDKPTRKQKSENKWRKHDTPTFFFEDFQVLQA